MSLTRRLLSAASIVLAIFLGATGLILDQAFRESAEGAARDRLQGHIFALLAAAEVDDRLELTLPSSLPDGRFAQTNSGLYARVIDAEHRSVWQSPSILNRNIQFNIAENVGEGEFAKVSDQRQSAYFSMAFQVVWEDDAAKRRTYTFQVAEDLSAYYAQIKGFRKSLWGWLAAVSLILLAVQGSILRWGLIPIHSVAQDLENIKSGKAEKLLDGYPSELQTLTQSINSFIASERIQRDRYRNTLSDLAHSLKTPLAILRGCVHEGGLPLEIKATLQQQVDRMSQIVDYQLQRAAAKGRSTLAKPIELVPLVERICTGLGKVYADKRIHCELPERANATFRGDEGDLMEVLGNVLDNAYKWANTCVRVSLQPIADTAKLQIVIEDDGPGIPEDRLEKVLQRGVRVDQNVDGQGIGLAVVRDIVDAYEGRLHVDRGELGGARISITLANE